MQQQFSLIPHRVGNAEVCQRTADGYVNATAMCKAVGKFFADYRRLGVTDAFLNELSAV
ncbi:MAG: KilA-N domain-containing protein, partial [Mucilaginibacter polytrichastri]|nr:KilA-N domain-containing protein [Mucilaginibacter polytrichastri]